MLKHYDLIEQMTLEEKCYFFSGKDFTKRCARNRPVLFQPLPGIVKKNGQGPAAQPEASGLLGRGPLLGETQPRQEAAGPLGLLWKGQPAPIPLPNRLGLSAQTAQVPGGGQEPLQLREGVPHPPGG